VFRDHEKRHDGWREFTSSPTRFEIPRGLSAQGPTLFKRAIVQSFYKTPYFWLDFDSRGRKYEHFAGARKIEKKIGGPSTVRSVFRRADPRAPSTSLRDALLTDAIDR